MKLYEIVVKNRPEFTDGFVHGFGLGRAKGEQVYRCSDYNISAVHLKKHIADMLGIGGKYSNYVVEESLVKPLEEAFDTLKEPADLETQEIHEVQGLRFRFEVRIFAKKLGEKAKRIIDGRDEEIDLSGYEPKEIIHEDAAMTELYAPEHDYELRGQGTAQGPFEKILQFYSQLSDIDQVHTEKMELVIQS